MNEQKNPQFNYGHHFHYDPQQTNLKAFPPQAAMSQLSEKCEILKKCF